MFAAVEGASSKYTMVSDDDMESDVDDEEVIQAGTVAPPTVANAKPKLVPPSPECVNMDVSDSQDEDDSDDSDTEADLEPEPEPELPPGESSSEEEYDSEELSDDSESGDDTKGTDIIVLPPAPKKKTPAPRKKKPAPVPAPNFDTNTKSLESKPSSSSSKKNNGSRSAVVSRNDAKKRGKGRPKKSKLPPFVPENYTPKPFKRSKHDSVFFSEQNTIKFQDANRVLDSLDSDVLIDDLFGKTKFIVPALTGYLRTVLVVDNTKCNLYAMTLAPGLPPRLNHDTESIKWANQIPPTNENKRESCEAIDAAIKTMSGMFDCANFNDSINPCTVLASELCNGVQGGAVYGFLLLVLDNQDSTIHFYPYPKMTTSASRGKARVSNREPKGVKFKHLVLEAYKCGNRNIHTPRVLKFEGHAQFDFRTAIISDADFKIELKSTLTKLKKEVDKRMSGHRSKSIPPHELVQGQFQSISTGIHSSNVVPKFVVEMYHHMYDYWFGFKTGSTYKLSLAAAQDIEPLSRISPAGCLLGGITDDSVKVTIVDTGRDCRWPPTARVSFRAFKTVGGGTEIAESDILASKLRDLIHQKGATLCDADADADDTGTSTGKAALPVFPVSKPNPTVKSKIKPKPKPNPKSKAKAKPKAKAKAKAKDNTKSNSNLESTPVQHANTGSSPNLKKRKTLSAMKTFKGIIVPESLLLADRTELLSKLHQCDKMIVPPGCNSAVCVKDMNHGSASTEELRARCADVFFGPVSPSTNASASTAGSSKMTPSPLRIKKAKREPGGESRSPKRARTSHGPGDGRTPDEVKQWFASNINPDSSGGPYNFILKRGSDQPPHKNINWLVTIEARDLSKVHDF